MPGEPPGRSSRSLNWVEPLKQSGGPHEHVVRIPRDLAVDAKMDVPDHVQVNLNETCSVAQSGEPASDNLDN